MENKVNDDYLSKQKHFEDRISTLEKELRAQRTKTNTLERELKLLITPGGEESGFYNTVKDPKLPTIDPEGSFQELKRIQQQVEIMWTKQRLPEFEEQTFFPEHQIE